MKYLQYYTILCMQFWNNFGFAFSASGEYILKSNYYDD